MSANDTQIGGDHYKRAGDYEHWDVIAKLYGPGYFIACASKYLLRWKKKNGVQDLEKAHHFLTKLLELADRGVVLLPLQLRKLTPQAYCSFIEANRVAMEDREMIWHILQSETVDGLRTAHKLVGEAIAAQRSLI